MSLIEEGAYFRLLCFSWINHGSIPNDEVWLALHSKLQLDEWRQVEPKVKKRFIVKKGRLIPKVLDAIFKEAVTISKTNSSSAVTRWSREKYFESELSSFNSLTSDTAWIESQQKFHPDLDILLSLEKAHVQFWSTEEGYAYFKSKSSKPRNWKKTLQNSLSIETNKVKKEFKSDSTSKAGLSDRYNKHAGRRGYDAAGNAIGAQAKTGEFDEGVRTLEGVTSL